MSLIRKHGAVLQAWACLALVIVQHRTCSNLANNIGQLSILVNRFCLCYRSHCLQMGNKYSLFLSNLLVIL